MICQGEASILFLERKRIKKNFFRKLRLLIVLILRFRHSAYEYGFLKTRKENLP